MKRRVVAAIAATVLALVGGVLVLRYVAGADARAQAGQELVSVLVVTKAIPKGTAGSALGDSVAVRTLPRDAVASGAVTDRKAIGDRVAAVDLAVGEQLLDSRFVTPASLLPGNAVSVPPTMEEVSLELEAERTIGAQLKAGDRVGVVISVKSTGETRQIANKVLVSRVQVVSDKSNASAAPTMRLIVTLAVPPALGQKIVWGKVNGDIWLTLQTTSTDTSGTQVITGETVLK